MAIENPLNRQRQS